MRATIDKAGRVVIPQPIREIVGLQPGEELEVELDGLTIRLSRSAPPPRLVRRGMRLVAVPSVPSNERHELDPAEWVRKERNRWPV